MKEGPMILETWHPVPVQIPMLAAMAVLIGLSLAARFSVKKTAPTGVRTFGNYRHGLENFIVEIMGTQKQDHLRWSAPCSFLSWCAILKAHPGNRFTYCEYQYHTCACAGDFLPRPIISASNVMASLTSSILWGRCGPLLRSCCPSNSSAI